MSAIDRLDAWLRISPSTVLPAEVLEYLDDVKAENVQLRQQLADVTESMGRVEERCAKLRELAKNLKACNSSCGRCIELYGICEHETELRELRVEVNV